MTMPACEPAFFVAEKIPTKSPQNSDIVIHDTDRQTGSETSKKRINNTVLHDTDIIMTYGGND